MNTVIVIPARGGSKGIPRKNLRPLAGVPMIQYSIAAAISCNKVCRVVVTTDDEEIAVVAEKLGASVIRRPESLANDTATLDPVIVHAVKKSEESFHERYDFVITVQPTSPLIKSEDIEKGINLLMSTEADTVISVVDDRHLNWTIIAGKAKKLYQERLNRQQLLPNYRETGAVIGCRRSQIEKGTRIGERIELLEIEKERSFDIDSVSDLILCEAILQRKRVIFVVAGYPEIGLGHAYRALMLASEFVVFEIYFVCQESSQMAAEIIAERNYKVELCLDGELLSKIAELKPDLVINDILDTSEDYIHAIKKLGAKVVNFEDIGAGSYCADLVVNALYPGQIPSENYLVGHEYFCLRDEFLLSKPKLFTKEVKRILITFGGVDEKNITCRVLSLILPLCVSKGMSIDVVVGPGFSHFDELKKIKNGAPSMDIQIIRGTSRISDFMLSADLAFTSGGRTVYEMASLQVPMIVVCQNLRETTHTFASSENGIVNLGFSGMVSDEDILCAFEKLLNDSAVRRVMHKKLGDLDLRHGRDRVISKIKSLLN